MVAIGFMGKLTSTSLHLENATFSLNRNLGGRYRRGGGSRSITINVDLAFQVRVLLAFALNLLRMAAGVCCFCSNVLLPPDAQGRGRGESIPILISK